MSKTRSEIQITLAGDLLGSGIQARFQFSFEIASDRYRTRYSISLISIRQGDGYQQGLTRRWPSRVQAAKRHCEVPVRMRIAQVLATPTWLPSCPLPCLEDVSC